MVLRFIFTLAAIGALLLLESGLQRPWAAMRQPQYYVLVFAFVFNLGYLVAAQMRASPSRMALLQLLMDVIVVSALVYLTGVDRVFAYLYFGTVLAGALLLSPRAGYLIASLATALLAGITVLYLFSVRWGITLPLVDTELWHQYGPRRSFLVAYLLLLAVSLQFVAFLSSLLANEVSRIRILNDEILQNMAGGVLAVDRYGRIAFLNEQASRQMGLSAPDRLRGRPFSSVLPEPIATTIEHALRGGTRVEREVRLGESPYHVVVSYLTDRPGLLRGVVAILNDLTLRRKMDAMVEREGRVSALVEMSAGMAHEVRNPLASIRGAAQELGSSPGAGEDDRKLLQVILRESDRLNKIISDFLDYASDRPLDLRPCELTGVLEESALLLEAREESKRVQVVRRWASAVSCRGDTDRLKQVFLNLGINAMEACAERGGRLILAAGPSADPRRPGIEILFEDDGPGIPSEAVARAFTPFYSTKPRGTGMGLAIARKIVLGHEGDIAIESSVGKGTRVRVWLPA